MLGPRGVHWQRARVSKQNWLGVAFVSDPQLFSVVEEVLCLLKEKVQPLKKHIDLLVEVVR